MSDRIPGSNEFNLIHYRGFDIYLECHPFHDTTWWTWIRTWPSCTANEEFTGNAWSEAECKADIDSLLGANDNPKAGQ